MKNRWFTASFVLIAVGAIIGTLLDGSHTHTHIIEYANPLFWMATWWTPLVFANGSLMTGLSRPLAEKLLGKFSPKQAWGSVIACNGFFYLSYIFSAYLVLTDGGKTIVLAILWLVIWVLFDRTLLAVGLSLVTAIIGPLFEIFLSSLGVFRYVQPDLFTINSWLPVLYAIASLASGQLGKALVFGTKTREKNIPDKSDSTNGGKITHNRFMGVKASDKAIQAWRALDFMPDEGWVNWAIGRLEGGNDGHYLRILAGLTSPFDYAETVRIADLAFEEVGLPCLEPREALISFATELLKRLLDGAEPVPNLLVELHSLSEALDDDQLLYPFWLLHHAHLDLSYEGEQFYWKGADEANIDQIVCDEALKWIKEHGRGD